MFRGFVLIMWMQVALFSATHSVCESERIEISRAKEIVESILKEEPTNAICMLQLANIYLKQGEIAKGFDTLVNAYLLDPHHVQNSKIASVLPFALKVTNLKLQAQKTNDKAIWNDLGDGYFEMGIFNEAALMYKQSLFADPTQHMIRLKRALALQKESHVYTALEEVQTVLNQEPSHVFANYYMAKFLAYDVKNRVEARVFFERARSALIAQKDAFAYLEYTNLLSDITKELGE
ncbi:tetratricopeptide repeat protein [Sulfurospirillum deleyianum]|uniref:Tetratricopeptide repeat protein n=1 Tax=Sulfurospirillum deleyianum (strain ATCC 51133 / DSM 6946 / 5175) TaxID=525898 RepID=D1B411_SULD5|nr:hypothetical protein [Sulfurospirillum deleyianum]ACZ12831.1 Tetratricopeptide repeat protein [Sulfurospirillum deleyianum DSM 6946]